MHFHQREQAALRAAGLSTDELQAVSEDVAGAAEREAERLAAFFDRDAVHSDLEMAHSTDAVHEHDLRFVDLYTHADEVRGYVRFDTWGAWVTDGRVLRPASAMTEEGAGESASEDAGREGDRAELVELTLGPTIHDRVRFAADPEEL